MSIGQRIKSLREQNQMTQEELGHIIGVNKATINRYETGVIDIKRTIAIKLADALHTTPAHLMGWEEVDQKSETLISPSDEKLLKNVRKLNATGRKKAEEYITDLLENPKYTESGPLDEVSKDIARELQEFTCAAAKKNTVSK